ncbi:hypothetical protein HY633_01050 [Candidatus Uhrbacteria bacterium]|nr:hypothetical protein [Candidatus Uhrbacteria bacterium]
MPRRIDRFAFRTLVAVAAALLSIALRPGIAAAGTQDNVEGWAWSGTIGWISLNCNSVAPPTCATVDYGVTFEDVPGFPDRGNLKGWAWSENVGWICFGITCAGTTPQGGASYAQYRGSYNGKTDEIFGWAKIDALGNNGWISLNCDNDPTTTCAVSSYHLVLDATLPTLTAPFTKGVIDDHWGWSGTSEGTGIGWIDFSSVMTTWAAASLGAVSRPVGVYEPTTATPGSRLFTFSISFSNLTAAQDDLLQCDIRRSDGTLGAPLQKIYASTVRHVAESLQYTVTGADPIDKIKRWEVAACRIAGPRTATSCPPACAGGQICEGGKCRNVIVTTTAPAPIFAHANAWTIADSDTDDVYLATQCFNGFPGKYFGNSWRCDFSGDADFSMGMSQGANIERYCGDSIDNDGNGETDCNDRHCKGISLLCRTPPLAPGAPPLLEPLSCTWGASGDNLADCTAGFTPGTICCTKQNKIVDGYECFHGIANDGYIDCDDPGAVVGDVCCSTAGMVQVK